MMQDRATQDRAADDTDGASQDQAQDQAHAWVVRMASGEMTVEEAAALRRWHMADPAHARAFAEAKRHWRVVGAATRQIARETRPSPVSRRWLLGGTAAAAAAAGVAAVAPPFALWSPVVDFTADYRTGIGERQTVPVGEHVTVQLSTRSRLSVQADRHDLLRVALLAGEAAVEAKARSVTVAAGGGEVRAVSGRFNLRSDDDLVSVTCLGGAVDVACGGEEVTLRGSQQARYGARGLAFTTLSDVDDVTAWQRGLLVFRNQPLRSVVDEINRYRPGRIIVARRELGERPVAFASVHLDRIDDVIAQMQTLYGANVRHLPGGIVLLS